VHDLFFTLTRNVIGRIGAALTTASAMVFLALTAVDLTSARPGPYLGILTYLLIPALFVLGLLLIPLGLALERWWTRKAGAGGGTAAPLPVVDLNVGRTRRMAGSFLTLTVVNLAVLGIASHKGAELLDSTRFCGTTCHTIMAPEYVTHRSGMHGGVTCVACHIGPGGTWYVRAKVSGARQVVEAVLDRYPRPIPTPVRNLRAATETCTECHDPARDVGEKRRVIRERADDEASTPQETVLLMKVGGRRGGDATGIHWHASRDVEIRYHSDARREVIDTVEVRRAGRPPETFVLKDAAPAPGGAVPGEWRVMDCVDCHNRAAHPSRSPEREVDEAIDRGLIDASLPFVRREAVRLLKEACGTHDKRDGACAAGLRDFYAKESAGLAETRRDTIAAAGKTIEDLGARNLFPAMGVTWGTYPSHLGHMDTPGCFRCHDGEHVTGAGRSISQDCDTCHRDAASS
jgi:hypothetical protein